MRPGSTVDHVQIISVSIHIFPKKPQHNCRMDFPQLNKNKCCMHLCESECDMRSYMIYLLCWRMAVAAVRCCLPDGPLEALAMEARIVRIAVAVGTHWLVAGRRAAEG